MQSKYIGIIETVIISQTCSISNFNYAQKQANKINQNKCYWSNRPTVRICTAHTYSGYNQQLNTNSANIILFYL